MSQRERSRRYRKSIRLKGYDYTQPGAYFVTVCSHLWRVLFGRIHGDEMRLSAYGRIVQACWGAIPQHFPSVELDAFQVMPNHIHGILFIVSRPGETLTPLARVQLLADLAPSEARGPARGSVGAIVGSLKSAATKQINQLRSRRRPPVWQPNYHEHIIRGAQELDRIRDYVLSNPANWALDRENPNRTGASAIEEELFRDRPAAPRQEPTDQNELPDADPGLDPC